MPPPPGIINPVWQPQLRAAAIWALGHIHVADPKKEGQRPPADLAGTLQERLRDGGLVGTMAAISLGRMKANDSAPLLRQIYQNEKESLAVRRACAWALERITGATMPALTPPTAREIWYGDLFLEPLGTHF